MTEQEAHSAVLVLTKGVRHFRIEDIANDTSRITLAVAGTEFENAANLLVTILLAADWREEHSTRPPSVMELELADRLPGNKKSGGR